MGKRIVIGILLILFLGGGLVSWADSPPRLQTLLKPTLFKKVTQDQEACVHASLEDQGTTQLYSFYASMQVKAGLELTRQVLTDYPLYAKMIPYVDYSDYRPQFHELSISGGIWMFKLSSLVRFEERSERWIHFRIIRGHFSGLEGDAFFEAQSTQGAPATLVYLRGSLNGSEWPPRFVIERGAEIVLSFTARKMRDYIESQKNAETRNPQRTQGAEPNGNQTPHPRSHL